MATDNSLNHWQSLLLQKPNTYREMVLLAVVSGAAPPDGAGADGGDPGSMPPLWVYEAADGALVVYDGAMRATRVAKLVPGTLVRVEVIGKLHRVYGHYPKIGDLLP